MKSATSQSQVYGVPTNRRQRGFWYADESSALHIAVALAMLLLASCGKSPEAAKPAAPEAPKAAVVSDSKIEAAITEALSAPTPAAGDLANEAQAILAQYPGKTAQDLLNVPEVSTKLRSLLDKLGQDKALLARINSSVDLAAQIKGLDGAAKLDLDMKGYDKARTARMLQAVLSEDPKQLVAYLVGEIGEAAPDLSFGGMDRAPNGVAIVPNPAAAPTTPAKTDLPD